MTGIVREVTTMFVRIWILVSAGFVGAGWILSLVNELNPVGYLALLSPGLIFTLWWMRRQPHTWTGTGRPWFHRFSRRFQKPAPQAFLILAGLALMTGVLYPPTPREESQYRTPRVLHWLDEGHWHWIRTFDIRMNIAGCGFEWLTAPLMLFTHTDHFFFLINFISYLLLPGLVFCLLRHLQVRGRVAWWAMWLAPAGYCYALQAGTVATDAFAAVYALAAVCFALRARAKKSPADLWLSLLAAALLTGSKQTNIPLAALWLVAALPALPLLRLRPLRSLAVICAALLASALPLMCLNWLHGCTPLGTPVHPGLDWTFRWGKTQLTSPFWGVIGNVFCLPLQTLAPPFFPFYEAWNGFMRHFTGTPAGLHFRQFEDFGRLSSYMAPESGMGSVPCLFLMASLLWGWLLARKAGPLSEKAPVDGIIHWLRWLPWFLLLLFMSRVGTYENARQLAPYYVFFLPLILAQPGLAPLVRRRSWQILARATLLATAAILILSPVTPLFPVNTLLNRLALWCPRSAIVLRLKSYYSTSEINREMRLAFRDALPPTETVVGYATDLEGLEPGLWRPFTRRVERVLPDDSPQEIRRHDLHYIVVDTFFLNLVRCNVDELLDRYHARLAGTLTLSGGWGRPPDHVYLFQLSDD